MPDPTLMRLEITERRRVEDALLKLGQAHAEVEAVEELNRAAIRSWLEAARAAGISVREIARLTGYSTQTLHGWMRDRMKPVPWAHLGLGDPPAQTLEEALIRTIAEEPERVRTAEEVLAAVPDGWPKGSVHQAEMALDMLARSGQIWRAEGGYQLADPEPNAHG